ncbi:DUF4394 domain-containing protein [Haliscomenobacter hydrossis]|uniref:DUF4394 domain-containing protein n=1 Tax=Haliscomenobacter hydrossis (strain ATCC 27775 / DSM 1100 / LMG 10767 / O) TaxID=760192 RepID=F4KXK5_HALH1|nr:DUF4394 domain-containing protein [Haliscomenobacter hydrossis]AEE50376.1 hypothetical protein Halhy_2503 [Haliscomenobacter hydrossis DSM 1100]
MMTVSTISLQTYQGSQAALRLLFLLLSLTFLWLNHTLQAQTIYGLSGNTLVTFDANSPALILSTTTVTGISAGQSIVGLDARPATGELYAMGYNASNGETRLYTINPGTGMASAIGAAAITLQANLGKISFDFNPTVDRIRVIGSNNANYRLHPMTGALVATDGNLSFATGDANAGKNPSIGACAYTNSYIGASATTLYNYDDSLNVLTTQIPPNNGVLNTIGVSGIVLNLLDPTLDMDIYFDAATNTNKAFIVANLVGSLLDNFYSINLSTGATTLIGVVGLGVSLDDIAAKIDRNVPAMVSGKLVYGLTTNGNLITFDSDQPAVVRSSVAVTGVAAGQVVAGLDSRPATGELYAIGYNSTSGEARLYTIIPSTGVATAIGAAPVMLGVGLGKISFDFNPTVDRIRVTSSSNANFRLHPTTGAIAFTDGNLAFAAGDANAGKNPSLGAGAYTNSYIGATSTTLYNYDDSLNILTTQNPPNNGVLNTVGASGLVLNLVDPSADLDIFFDEASSTNIALLSVNTLTQVTDQLFKVNLSSGVASLVGAIGLGIGLTDIAVAIDRTVPAQVTGQLIYALATNNNLLTIDSDLPRTIRTAVAVTGVAAGQTLVGMDVRPATGELYALGYNASNGESQLYTINTTTAVATTVGTASVQLSLGTGNNVGFDFNPTVDRIRVIAANNANYRLHPVTGAIAFTDGNLAFAAGDVNVGKNPAVGTGAYTNSFNTATTTTLYTIDDSLAVLLTQIPPNNGTLNTIGVLGVGLNLADLSTDLDIYYNFATSSNLAFLVANTGNSTFDGLFTLNLTTGLASTTGTIGNGIAIRDIAIAIDSLVTVGTRDMVRRNANQLSVYPNPMIEQTNISFELPVAARTKVLVADVSGRQIAVIMDQQTGSGKHLVNWNRDNALAPGFYFIQLYVDGTLQGLAKVIAK